MKALGIMSGTSLDGVDYALCEVSARRMRWLELWHVQFPLSLRSRLDQAARGQGTIREFVQLHHDLGRFYAQHAARSRRGLKPELIGLHGQTIYHSPDPAKPATFQAGEPAYLVEALGVPVVSNFRVADLAAGGQGAPLATAFHCRVFGRRGAHICVHNLGGISNVTSIDWRQGPEPSVLGFDTGPANILVDLAMRHFSRGRLALDRNGAWAARGRVCHRLVCRWLEHPYFAARPPKSTGRELFGEDFLRRVLKEARGRRLGRCDVVASLTELSAQSLALNYQRHLPGRPQLVVLAGGGAANPVLVERIGCALRERCGEVRLETSEQHGWPLQAIEPAAFALLAYLRLQGQPGNRPETTGARHPALLGQVSCQRTCQVR